jgi:hypothetical protein
MFRVLGYTSSSAALILVSGYYHDSEYSNILSNLFFYVVLAVLLCRAYLIREQGIRVILGVLLALLSWVIWYYASIEDRLSSLVLYYYVVALGSWVGASWFLLGANEKKVKRTHFSTLVKWTPL